MCRGSSTLRKENIIYDGVPLTRIVIQTEQQNVYLIELKSSKNKIPLHRKLEL